MINVIKLKIASIPLSGKILTLTENTSFLLRTEGVKTLLFTLLKKMSCFFSTCRQPESFFTSAPWSLGLDCHMYSILFQGGVKEVAFDPCHE